MLLYGISSAQCEPYCMLLNETQFTAKNKHDLQIYDYIFTNQILKLWIKHTSKASSVFESKRINKKQTKN